MCPLRQAQLRAVSPSKSQLVTDAPIRQLTVLDYRLYIRLAPVIYKTQNTGILRHRFKKTQISSFYELSDLKTRCLYYNSVTTSNVSYQFCSTAQMWFNLKLTYNRQPFFLTINNPNNFQIHKELSWCDCKANH